jgi:hypothetical protein
MGQETGGEEGTCTESSAGLQRDSLKSQVCKSLKGSLFIQGQRTHSQKVTGLIIPRSHEQLEIVCDSLVRMKIQSLYKDHTIVVGLN